MKKCFFLISLFIAFVANMNLKAETSSDEVFVMVEQMPTFPGGQKALFAFLAENTKYPIEAIQQGIEGKVICQFIVEKDGSIDSIQVIRSVYPSLDTEAVRVLGLMPQWKPGRNRGKIVRVRYSIPVSFRLQIDTVAEQQVQTTIPQNDTVFTHVEQMPEFPGGEQAFWNFLSSNMRYPVIAVENNIEGEVVVQFIVEKDGSITDVQVVKSVDPSLDKEAVRMVRIMPKWQAGMQQGKPVRVKYIVPVKFRLGHKIKFRK